LTSWRKTLYGFMKAYSKRLRPPQVPRVILTEHEKEPISTTLSNGPGDAVIFLDKRFGGVFKWNRRKAKRALEFVVAHELAHVLGHGEWKANRISREFTGISRTEFNETIKDYNKFMRSLEVKTS